MDPATAEASTIEDWPHGAVAAEADRFEFWSINLGLFVPGHGSLDYRLRLADSLRYTIGMFLTNLKSALSAGGSNIDHEFSLAYRSVNSP